MLCFGFLIIFSCSAPTAAVPHASFCDIAKPIQWAAADTRKTKEQADSHNRVGKQLCGWGAKPH